MADIIATGLLFEVNADGTKFNGRNESDIPWKRCNSALECIAWIEDPNNPVKFSVTYDSSAKFLIEKRLSCGM